MKRTLSFVLLLVCACGESGQDRVELDLYLAGNGNDTLTSRDGSSVTLSRADLAFGPLVLCAGTQAGEVCDTARLEWLDSAVVDCLNSDAQRVGQLEGVTGRVRSFMYDLGLSSQLTQEEPLVLGAAQELDGASLVLEGQANVGGTMLPFQASVVVAQGQDAERGIPVVRRSTSDDFDHVVDALEAPLLVRFDPRPWVGGVDFEQLIAATCPDGDIESCPSPLVIDPESQAYRSVTNALTSGARPSFHWEFEP